MSDAIAVRGVRLRSCPHRYPSIPVGPPLIPSSDRNATAPPVVANTSLILPGLIKNAPTILGKMHPQACPVLTQVS